MNCPKEWQVWLDECLKVALKWQTPPNWSAKDWQEEMKGTALLAGWAALCSYNENYGAPLEKFVKAKVKAALLQRYREEWRFASRCHQPHCNGEGEGETPLDDEFADLCAEDIFWWRVEVRDMLTRLPPHEHYFIERLFIDGATESEVAAELNISQSTVSRWKQQLLEKLRQMIKDFRQCVS